MHEAAAADAWVGRADLLARVETDLEAVQLGSGRALLLTGEPGIGKTRAVAEAIAVAAAFGLAPILVSCRREAPAFWPWVRVLRACDAALGAGRLAALVRDDATWIRVLVPDLCGGASEVPISGDAGPDGHFALADAIARSLAKVAAEVPLLVALDDLHEADGGTLLALSLVADALRATPLALLGTHRDAELDADPERASMLARVARCGERIALRGLSAAEVDALLRARGVASDPALAARVHARTGGKPLFVVALARELRAGHSAMELPDGVREVVRARLARLADPIRSLLDVAALIGERFQPALLATASGTAPAEVVALLERAARERLVLPIDDALGAWRFPHDLLREAIAAQIGADARAAIHLRIGEALAAEGPAEGDRLTALSHHFYECAAIGGAARAVDCARRAARQERARGALGETAAQLRRARAALALAPECGDDRADR
jgi:predicted ATPase